MTRSKDAKHSASVASAPHPATLADEILLRQCEIRTGRVGGPGGQHRNKVETAVYVLHTPTGVEAQATERRSQIENRAVALARLRVRLAVEVRSAVQSDAQAASALWISRRRDQRIRVSIEHRDFPTLLAEALDVTTACAFDLAKAAQILGVSTTQLAKFLRQDKFAAERVNAQRKHLGLHPLRD